MEAERLYTKQPSRTIQQKRGGEGALEMVDNRPASKANMLHHPKNIAQFATTVNYWTNNFEYYPSYYETVGSKIMAYLDSTDPRQGSEPGNNELANTMFALKNRRYYSMIRGHLLNGLLGGPGLAYNLFPITSQANKLHMLYAENHIKKYLSTRKSPQYGVMYSVEVTDATYEINNPKCAFTCEAYPWNPLYGPNEKAVDKLNPILYPIDIVSQPEYDSNGSGDIVELPSGIDAYGREFDYGKQYQAYSLAFNTSNLFGRWASIGRGKGRNRNFSYFISQ